ncbi:MAG: ABC transporter substrate-binding protein [Anaerolineae bacterium]|jgi:ABC-type oligopeptide transport system substrate-binding subunit/DNA-binding SARP family transcriptional activator|nr:ABC transporter substrate-binding protein [Anaerolineae bacterium]
MTPNGDRLAFALLGGFRAYCAERGPLDVPQARFQRMLAYLLLNRSALPTRHQLAFLFWPDTSERQALGNLRTLIHRLRESFPIIARYLDLDSETLKWQMPVELDVADFENARQAASDARAAARPDLEEGALAALVRAYSGELLPGYYDDWLSAERERLHAAYLEGLERLATLLEDNGRHGEAALLAQTLLRADGLRESGHRLLMRIQLAQGDRTAALRAYHTCAALLRRELGVDPDAETQALHLRILRIEDLPATAPASARSNGRIDSAPLIGRHAEWRDLLGRWQAAKEGHAQVVLLTGEAGAGRSRLAEAFLSFAAAHGSLTASAHCAPTSKDLAYAPVAEWFHNEPLRERLRGLAPAHAEAVTRLIEPAGDGERTTAPAGAGTHHWLWEALTAALLAARRAPLALLIDDAHWCDAWTLNWLTFALRQAPDAACLVLITAPLGDAVAERALRPVRAGLAGRDAWGEIAIGPLSEAETGELAARVAGARLGVDAVARLHRITGGNPLFLIELLHAEGRGATATQHLSGEPAGESGGPHDECAACPEQITLTPRLDEVMRRRLEALSAPARRLAEAAAVIGRPFSLELLARAAGLPEAELIPALDELWRRLVIREHDGDRYAFGHELLRVAAYRELGPARRKALHRAVADSLAEAPEGQMRDAAAHLAHHLSLGGLALRAAEQWLQAGDGQRLLLAEAEAAGYYRRAGAAFAEVGERERAARALMKAGLASHAAFHFEDANRAYDAAFELWRQTRTSAQPILATANRTLRSHWSSPASLDPALGADFMSSAVITQLYSGLARHSPELEVTPDIATGWEVLDEGRRYVIHLRRDAQWNDGAPVTAGDFAAAWRRVLDPLTRSGHAELLDDIVAARAFRTGETADPEALGVVAADDWTLEVCLETPAPYFPHLLAHPVTLPLPRHAFGRAPLTGECLSELVTNGPLMLAEWERGAVMRLARNPRYHGLWRGNVQDVLLALDIDSAEMLRRYDADELDVVRLSGDYSMAELQQVQRTHAGEFRSGPRLVTWQLGFDTSQPPFDDARVRRAFAMTCDRERLAHGQLKGLFTPADGGFVPPGMPGHSPGIALPFDPAEARRLLAAAGYPGGAGFPEVTLVTDNWAGDTVEYMAAEWQRWLGVTVRTEALAWAEFLGRMTSERVPMYYSAWRADYPDPDSFLRCGLRWHATPWRDAEYEGLLASARSARSSPERLACYTAADALLSERAGIAPVVYGWMHLLMKPRVRRYPFSGIRPWFWTDVEIED